MTDLRARQIPQKPGELVDRLYDRLHIRLNSHETGDPLAHQWMVVEGENANWGAAGHDASLRTFAGLGANNRDHHVRLGGVA